MKFRFRTNKKPKRLTKFAWWPRKLDNGTWVWLERYSRYRMDYLTHRSE